MNNCKQIFIISQSYLADDGRPNENKSNSYFYVLWIKSSAKQRLRQFWFIYVRGSLHFFYDLC